MRCFSISPASEYKMDLVFNYYSTDCITTEFDEVLYVKQPKNNTEFFVFPFGCVVIWGAEEPEEQIILSELSKFEIDPVEKIESDLIYFNYSDNVNDDIQDKTYIDEEENKVILANNSEYLKISISYGLAQSVKLKILESSVSKILQSTAPINKELAKTGGISMSKKEISKQIGNLFNERYSINLHTDILDTPEFFWRRPNYEPLYLMATEFQDIKLRHSILNHRLDIIQELYNILCNELNYKHSTRLEITIVVLITIEVALALLHEDIFSKIFSCFT
ncbi:MAG: hypothetical protein DGJ47_000189 [Rickettsiaceae bacterium]